MATSPEDLAAQLSARKSSSRKFLEANYFDEWQQVAQAYYCERDYEKDDDGNDDRTQATLSVPNTFSYVRRNVARITAQPPHIRFRAKDSNIADLIGRTLMYQWDKGHAQRPQKMHVQQALLFGWSVKAWHWASDSWMRSRRVDPNDGNPETLQRVFESYADWLAQRGIDVTAIQSEEDARMVIGELLKAKGRGNLLKVKYEYAGYVGCRSEVLFIGDCYPEPYFTSIQSSNWFQCERRRDRSWFENLAKVYGEEHPELLKQLDLLFEKYPRGSQAYYNEVSGSENDTLANFRTYFAKAQGRDNYYSETTSNERSTQLWTVTEEHVPGEDTRLRLMAERDIWLGDFPAPYDLDGKIPFTELLFIDNLTSGIGDSAMRILRGLQEMHSNHFCKMYEAYDKILRPLIATSDPELYENSDRIKRGKGFRLAFLRRGPESLWMPGEQGAAAAAAASLSGDQTAVMQMWQQGTGESNMSMSANVDPAQSATATGARIMAYVGDVLTKDGVDMFTEVSLKPDAEMMFEITRSEMTEPLEFEANAYTRQYSFAQDPLREQWVKAEPLMFQADGEIVVEIGSTLAADDQDKLTKAQLQWSMFRNAPDVNQQTLLHRTLVALGEGANLQQWAAPQPPPPPPPPPKASVSVSIKGEDLIYPTPGLTAVLQEAGIELQSGAPPPPNGAPAPGMGGPPPPGQPIPPGAPPPVGPPPPPPNGPMDGGMYAASRGVNPLR